MRNEVFEGEDEKKNTSEWDRLESKSFYYLAKFFKMKNCGSGTELAVNLAPENQLIYFPINFGTRSFNSAIHGGRVFVLDMTGGYPKAIKINSQAIS